jgi:hypothetical protein
MAHTYSYTFDNLSRIGNDSCAKSVRDIQNQNVGNYLTKNYFESMCGMKKPISFATNQPNVFYNAAPHSSVGAGGCNVESDSNLKIGQIQTHPKCKINLNPRPFLTVPFLGRGPSKPVLESKLMQSSYSGDKKSCKNLMEQSFNYDRVDLVPSLKASIQNPSNLIEGVAANGWIRGGLPSRELSRDNDYFKKN